MSLNGLHAFRWVRPLLARRQTFCVLESCRRVVSRLRALLLILCLLLRAYIKKKKSLWGRMPEPLCTSLDSYHGNQGPWQLMFHLQINYSALLMEENVSFFHVCLSVCESVFFFLSLVLKLLSGAFASLHTFPPWALISSISLLYWYYSTHLSKLQHKMIWNNILSVLYLKTFKFLMKANCIWLHSQVVTRMLSICYKVINVFND